PFRVHFVLAANFSGFLQSSKNLDKARPQLDQIFLWAGAKQSQVIWLEPQTKGATTLFGRITESLKVGLQWLKVWKSDTTEGPQALTDCMYQNLFRQEAAFAVRLAL